MKLFITVLLSVFSVTVFSQSVTIKDLQLLPGIWKGTLTYIDYSSGKPYTMPANIDVAQIEQTGKFIVALSYPNEPKANGNDTFSISKNGKIFNGGNIVRLQRLKNGGIIITTEQEGEDGNDNRKAVLKHIYSIQRNSFTNRKEVRFIKENKWILRNEYQFSR